MASQILKKTTGITGLAVSRDPHHSLKILYSKILKTLESFPNHSAYKKHTQGLVEKRLTLVNGEKNISKLEEKISSGQIEEVIKQAENELILSRKLLEWKAWETLAKPAPPNQWKWPI